MTTDQLHLMVQAAQACRWQQESAERAVGELWRTGNWVSPPAGISPARWRGMVLRALVDLKQAARSTDP
jgi:hypothetical protein